MNAQNNWSPTRIAAALFAVAVLLTGCGRREERSEHHGHDHDGHTHAQSAAPAGASNLMCAEHGVPEAECGICRSELAGRLKPGESVKVRLPSPESAMIAGVRTASPEHGAIGEGVECLAEVSFNQNKLAQIIAPVAGIIQAVEADLGARVEEQQVVARLWSASVAEAVAKAVLSHQALDRERKLRAQRVTSEKDLQEAEAAHRAACQQLRLLGFSEEQVDAMGAKPQETVLLDVRAPFAGEIVERTAVRGAMVEAGKPLFTIADRAIMWANLNIPETALAGVRVGQPVELTVDALPGRTFAGTLTWISPAVDDRTRLARARAEVSNPGGELRDKMFARARIITRRARSALLLPDSAIVRVEGNPLVFVKVAGDLFEARAVRLGARANGRQEVLDALKPDDQVVVAHSFAIKSQLLISRLGAGCVDD
ncbi:MAG: efflux RND transporter periplasmic adaptor subunit [Verrucomicrobiae bacterium]|nr:efflux RND transporter periplasmic adaptor subunit [Verrucomicrobiae bacterium]